MRARRIPHRGMPGSRKVNLTMLYPHPLPHWAHLAVPVGDNIFEPEFEKPDLDYRDDDDPEYLAELADYQQRLAIWNRFVSIKFTSLMNFHEGHFVEALEGLEKIDGLATLHGWPKSRNWALAAKAVTRMLAGEHLRAQLDTYRLRTVGEFHKDSEAVAMCECLDSLLWMNSDGAVGSRPSVDELKSSAAERSFGPQVDAVYAMLLVVDGCHLEAAQKFLKVAFIEQDRTLTAASLVWLAQAAWAYWNADRKDIANVLWLDMITNIDTVRDAALRELILDGAQAAGVVWDQPKAA